MSTTNDAPPNTITMNPDSDMAGLSMAQIYELNQSSLAASAPENVPYIGELLDIEVLRAEYEKGNQAFVAQIDWLKDNGYTKFRRTRGDGDCFYRSLAFTYINRILNHPDAPLATAQAESSLTESSKMLEAAGFDKMVWEDFYDVFISVIQRANGNLQEDELVQIMQDPESSNAIVMYLRLLTSAQLCADPDEYIGFLYDAEMDELVDAKDFCRKSIEPMGVEADHLQMTLLSRALGSQLKIAQVNGRDSKVGFFETQGDEDRPLLLLYRPGHYDILVKE